MATSFYSTLSWAMLFNTIPSILHSKSYDEQQSASSRDERKGAVLFLSDFGKKTSLVSSIYLHTSLRRF